MNSKYDDLELVVGERLLQGQPWPCRPRAVLSAWERELLFWINEALDRQQLAVLTGTPLSQLVNAAGFTEVQKKFWLETAAGFVILRVLTRSPLLLVLPADSTSNAVRMLLETRRCPYLLVDEGAPAKTEALRVVEAARRSDPAVDVFRPYGSGAQWLLAQHVKHAFWIMDPGSDGAVAASVVGAHRRKLTTRQVERCHWTVLEEVRLDRIVDFPRCPYTRLTKYMRQSPVDILVVNSKLQRPSHPLLAIEFDGRHHDDADQHVKDQVKNFLLRDAGIPILRLSYRDVSLRRWDRSSSEDYAHAAATLAPVLRVARLLVNDLAHAHDLARTEDEYDQAVNARAEGLFGKRWDELTANERDCLNDDPVCQELWADIQVFRRSEELFRAEQTSLSPLSGWLAFNGIEPERVRLTLTRTRQMWSTEAHYRTGSGEWIRIPVPDITLRLQGVAQDLMDRSVAHSVHEILVEAISQIDAVR